MNTSWLRETTLKAHVDRLRFTIEPLNPTTRQELAVNIPATPRRGRPHCEKVTARWDLRQVGDGGDLFEVTVHDPVSMPAVIAILDRMKVRLPLKQEPRLTILEIAMDVWPKRPGHLDLERIVADLFKGAKFEPSGNSRAARTKHEVSGLYGPDTTYRRLREGYTIYNGNASDPFMVRAYVKRTDNGLALPSGQHRARFEIEMKGDGLPVVTVAELGAFNFQDLSSMFLMRTVRADLPALAAHMAAAVPKLRRYPRITRGSHTFMDRAFAPFNKRVYRALERLTVTMQNTGRSPFHAGHLDALLGRLPMTDQSVTADYFFHPTIDVTPNPHSPNAPVLLTTHVQQQQDPEIDTVSAA